jgi:hypothetical protein
MRTDEREHSPLASRSARPVRADRAYAYTKRDWRAAERVLRSLNVFVSTLHDLKTTRGRSPAAALLGRTTLTDR